ncbi:E3 ubiquitin-protein ligase lubel-like [Episyrphus balteatus]|uniref:E3 ubiquitin-protein ligase lubel-like n=1 Tax=Episyrphus balteatus TaxID=286459 RepID=UPI0024865AA3|nr:E3 ubiquitin-protein ligase lubel-like [Episyrphus balteatus]
MEQVQAKQNGQILRSMEDMLGNLLAKKSPLVEAEMDSDAERIFMKSPIYSNRNASGNNLSSKTGGNDDDDVKNFVWQHIQDIVPNLVEQVERDLLEPSSPPSAVPAHFEEEEAVRLVEPPPIDADEFIMEEVIRPNLKNSTEEEEPKVEMEEVQVMEDFKTEQERALLRKQTEEYDLIMLKNLPHQVFKSAIGPESSSEEESSEEESSEEEDSQEEISSRDSQTPSTANKNQESVKKSATIVNVKADQKAESPELQVKTEEEVFAMPITSSTSVENSETPEDLPTTTTEDKDETSKKDKSQGNRGYIFRFGFNSSRRNRRPRTRRSIKREKKNADNEIEGNESHQSEYLEAEEMSASVENPAEIQTPTQEEDKSGLTEEIQSEDQPSTSTSGKDIQVSSSHNEIIETETIVKINEEPDITEKKTNKNLKKRSNIPSCTKLKQIKNTDITPQANHQSEHTVETENKVESSPKNIESDVSNQTLLKTTPPLEVVKKKNNSEDIDDSKPSTSSTRKTSQLKKPKIRNAVKQSKTVNPEDIKSKEDNDALLPSTSTKTKESLKISDAESLKATESIEETEIKPSSTKAPDSVEVKAIVREKSKAEEPLVSQQSLSNENSVSSPTLKKKPSSKIPVRRTTSSTSLKSIESTSNSLTPTPTTESSKSPFNFEEQQTSEKDQKGFSTEDEEQYLDVQSASSEDEEDETNFYNAIEDVVVVVQPVTANLPNNAISKEDEDNSDQELYSIADSEEPNSLSTRDLMQSPSSENEVLLILDNQSSSSAILQSSSATITPVSSSKSIDFKYSDPSKQNLSELVEDTQRLIKQMKEEINIDMAAYDSEDEDYSDDGDDYSYEDYEEEYEEDEDDEEEEENSEEFIEEEETENDEEYSNADIGESDNEDHLLEDVQEETAQDQTEIDDIQLELFSHNKKELQGEIIVQENIETIEEELQSLPHIPSTDHASLVVVVENSVLTNEQLPVDTDLNTISVVSGVPVTEEEKSTSSLNSEAVLENDIQSVIDNVEITTVDDTSVVKGLKQVQSEMKKVLQSEPQKSEITEINDSKPSTSNVTKLIVKESKVVEQSSSKKLLHKKSQESRQKSKKPSVAEENVENSLQNGQLENSSSSSSTQETLQENDASKSNLSKASENVRVLEESNQSSTSRPNQERQSEEPIIEESKFQTEIKYTEPRTGLPKFSEPTTLSNSSKNDLQSVSNQENSVLEVEEPSSSSFNIQQLLDEQLKINNLESATTNKESSISNNEDLQTNSDPSSIEEPITEIRDEPTTSATPIEDHKDLQNKTKPPSTSLDSDNIPGTSNARKSPPKKTASKIPKPKTNSKPIPVPTRSKSFSAPSPIGVSSVRAIQQELFNKQAQLAKTPAPSFQKPPPPKLVRKKSITDAISKFTQATSEHTIQRSRTQPKIPKIPKKKYHETCFSDDDYQDSTSDDEEPPPPAEARLRKQSAPVFRTYASIIELQVEQPEICARRLMDEQLVTNMAEAQIAAALVGMRFQQDVSIWAAKECCDLEQAISLLQQECELCMGSYPMNQIVSMLKCTHKCCKQCAKNYFTIQITDRSINDCNCPFCKTPELNDPNVLEDENLEYFSNLDIFIKNIVEPEVHELFQRKLRDRTLMQDPNFKWCIQCSSGFFARPKQKRLICPDCGSVTCSQCRKTWEKQHEGLTCEKFQEWKDANDPEIQAKGVAEHLAINGIDCPKCRFKYSLARGGCMHFTCTQCKFEFCYGCGRPFMMGAKCTISPYCSKLGLHSHHPRSCLFYLRDKEPHTLQNLLLQNDVPFDVDPIVVEGGSKSSSKCPIPLQKETPKGLVDTVCNSDVQNDHAGLCRQHYVEYLAGKVSKASIDPLPILDLTDCVQELRRRGLPLPERGPWDTDEIYREMCSKVIKEKIPL